MHIGLMMECDFREGRTPREAFDEALATAEAAEALGFDGIWLAERRFAAPGGAAPVSSIGSAPLLLATAIATGTSRLRVGTAVLLLPLGHPVRLAEEVATLDHLSHGRLNLGIGRSSFPRSYEGYNIAYEESRARFREYLDVMRLAWTQERFSYAGTFYTFRDVELIPKPYQHPHPPIDHAATTRETFAAIGTSGFPLLVGLASAAMAELTEGIAAYRLPGRRQAILARGRYGSASRSMWRRTWTGPDPSPRPVPCPTTSACDKPTSGAPRRLKTLHGPHGRRVLPPSPMRTCCKRAWCSARPRASTERLSALRHAVGLSGIIMEPNVGGRIPHELLLHSMRLFAQEVAPSLR